MACGARSGLKPSKKTTTTTPILSAKWPVEPVQG
jgi:hypothetical protein